LHPKPSPDAGLSRNTDKSQESLRNVSWPWNTDEQPDRDATDDLGYHHHANNAAENQVIECLIGLTVAGRPAAGRPAVDPVLLPPETLEAIPS